MLHAKFAVEMTCAYTNANSSQNLNLDMRRSTSQFGTEIVARHCDLLAARNNKFLFIKSNYLQWLWYSLNSFDLVSEQLTLQTQVKITEGI